MGLGSDDIFRLKEACLLSESEKRSRLQKLLPYCSQKQTRYNLEYLWLSLIGGEERAVVKRNGVLDFTVIGVYEIDVKLFGG
jgi:hypothetical protein